MSKKVIIDVDECLGCETCVELYPEVFEMDSDSDKAVVIMEQGGDEDQIEEAIAACPAECIYWED